jgi:hypothetical protein
VERQDETHRQNSFQQFDRAAPRLMETQVSGAYRDPEAGAQNRHDVRMLPHGLRADKEREQLPRE